MAGGFVPWVTMVDDDQRAQGTDNTLLDLATPSTGTPAVPPGLPAAPATRYTLGEPIGIGGMGEVILAVDEQIGREVAVKRIRADTPTDEEVARFVREARVQARLDHPAVVPVHDIATDRAGKPFFVMKRLAGTDMKELLERVREGDDGGAIRKRLLRAFVDVCLCVEFAHNRGIVHRDLKPANVMLGEYGEVYVLDWGIARAVDEVETGTPMGRPTPKDLSLATGPTRAGAILGTPAYMAPEQIVGQRAGASSDVYSLGCILYEIAAGVPLHEGTRSIASTVVASDSAPSLVRADSPPELDAICARATAVEPERRFASARALGEAVQAFLDGDRDVAARKELAQQHVQEARVAHAKGDRKLAMRAAGRALALDPTASEAAELITSLVLAPPDKVPAEVERALYAVDVATGKSQAKLGAVAMTGFLWFVPLLWWTGIRDWTVVVAFTAVTLLTVIHVWAMSRQNRIPHAAIYANSVINAVLIAIVCRLVGPFVIAPTLVVTTLMAYAVHPAFGRMPIIAATLACGVFVPWALEAAGAIEPTYHFVNGSIVLTSPSVTFSSIPVQIGFALVLVMLVLVTAILLRYMSTRQREVTKQIELQAWHLRQLVAPR
jgi:serine/threonine-protein kinase